MLQKNKFKNTTLLVLLAAFCVLAANFYLLYEGYHDSRTNTVDRERIFWELFNDLLVMGAVFFVGYRFWRSFERTRQQADHLVAKQKEQAWQAEGYNKVIQILTYHDDDYQALSKALIPFLTDYLGAMAAVFLIVDEKQGVFRQIGGYGFSDNQQQLFPLESGLPGRAYKQQKPILLEDGTGGRIRSAMTEIVPQVHMIIPLHFSNKTHGVLEIAFLEALPDYKVLFIEQMGMHIGATLAEIKHDITSDRLLKEAQEVTQYLRAQEEELRQNVEELSSVQEQLEERMRITEAIKNELSARDSVLNKSALVTESDLYGKITYANEYFCRISQYTPEECIGQPHSLIRHPDTPREVFREMWTTIRSGRIFHATYKNRRKDGAAYWVEASIAPVLDSRGEPLRYIGVRFEITERVERAEQIEKLLREAEQHTDQLKKKEHDLLRQVTLNDSMIKLLNSSALVTEADLYGNITYANQKFCEISKFSLEECIGKPHSLVRHPETPKEVFADMWRTIKSGGIYKGVIRNRSKDGNDYWVDATIGPVMGENGLPIKYISIRFDITKQVRQSLQIEQLLFESLEINKKLQQKEEDLLTKNEDLSRARVLLQEYNENLEGKIAERTNEILQQKQEIEHQKDQIESSIRYAKRIQEAMLPHEEDIIEVFPKSFVIYHPRDIVSGDFYWLFKRGQRQLLAAGDCTGHGVPGALMSMIGMNKLAQVVQENGIVSAGNLLTVLNTEVRDALRQQTATSIRDGFDISVCVLDHQKGVLEFAGANHPLVYVKNQELSIIKGDKCSIGGHVTANHQYTTHTLHLDSPTTIYLFSDGYQDQFGGPDNRKFMVGRFRHLLGSISTEPIGLQKQLLEQTFDNWRGHQRQIDDIMVIGIQLPAMQPTK
jgi:PAS domain S-box-containing protein